MATSFSGCAKTTTHLFVYKSLCAFSFLVSCFGSVRVEGEKVMSDTIYPWSEATTRSKCSTQIYSYFSFSLSLSLSLCLAEHRSSTTTDHLPATLPEKENETESKTTRYITDIYSNKRKKHHNNQNLQLTTLKRNPKLRHNPPRILIPPQPLLDSPTTMHRMLQPP